MSAPIRSRGTGLARTLVVASATLAILLVCFSIYQYSQFEPDTAAAIHAQRLPSPPTEPAGYRDPVSPENTPGVSMGERGIIGPGEKARITIYGREGTDARIELTVSDWTPVPGVANQFLLSKPDVRMRTRDGHAVRIQADRGQLEAQRKGAGGLDPQRGKLEGDVVIQYDRLTDTQRKALPEDQRGTIRPEDLIQIEMGVIEFDFEYARLMIPGKLTLRGSDVELDAADLEMRFNEAENRVESLRINSGGSLTLKAMNTVFGAGDSGQAESPQRLTLVDWLRGAMQAGLRERGAAPKPEPIAPRAEPQPEPEARVVYTDTGVPIFRPLQERNVHDRPPLRYFARFQGAVDARQIVNQSTISHLRADSLEILRDLTEQVDRETKTGRSGDTQKTAGPVTPSSSSPELHLTWAQHLIVEACVSGDPRCDQQAQTSIQATGAPATLTHPEGRASGNRLIYEPDGGKATLKGTETTPAVLYNPEQGTLRGVEIHTERNGDDVHIRVKGPGSLQRSMDALADARPSPSNDSTTHPGAASEITFDERLDVHGRWVTETRFQRAGLIVRRQRVRFDRASFAGDVRLQHEDTRLQADALSVFFADRRYGWGRHEQTIQRVTGQGHVLMSQSDNRITCRDIDIHMAPGRDGRIVPELAIARGDVTAEQGRRTIHARDKLIVDLASVPVPPRPFDASKAYAAAVDAGLDIAAIDWASRRRAHEQSDRKTIGVTRLQAFGEVVVHDPLQTVDATAELLDAGVQDGRTLETVHLTGSDDRPVSVRLNAFTVVGKEIDLNVVDEWADVPDAGRLTFRSYKDLDGRRLDEPIPITVTWSEGMKFRGRENRAVFEGDVHAVSRSTTTFDCDRLIVEFDEVARVAGGAPMRDWWIFEDLFMGRQKRSPSNRRAGDDLRLTKEPSYILATGHAVALTSDFDESTGSLKSRTRLSGPQLSVNLRADVTKMMIEGKGDLLIEDYRQAPAGGEDLPAPTTSLFSLDEKSGPSVTLIEWNERMWYDYGVSQIRFTGGVGLKHFSGAQLKRVRGRLFDESTRLPPGRATFLTCRELTMEFAKRKTPAGSNRGNSMGGLSSDRIKQFQAEGSVVLQDQREGLAITGDRMIYWKDRHGLAVYGSPGRQAHIVVQQPGKLPQQASVDQLFYNLDSGELEVLGVELKTR